MSATFITILLLVLLFIRCPVGFALSISGALGLYLVGGTQAVFGVLSSMPRDTASAYEFLTIPMFLLMAEFVLRSGVADDLFRAASAWFGRIPGGLGIATALAGAGFGAICGSSTASAATLSSTSLKAMLEQGYEPRMASGAVAISGTLAMLIPPSIAMVIYGLLADVGIAQLLIAGIIPGLLVTFTIGATVFLLAKINPEHAPLAPAMPLREKIALLKGIGPMLVLLMAVSGVIYTGIATPTEAAALGALFAGLLFIIRRGFVLGEMTDLLRRAIRTSCMIGIILLGAHIFSTFFALTQTTQALVTWVGQLDVNPWTIMIVLLVIYLILGCFLDQMAILVLTIPIVAPLVQSLGFDLIWFGIVVIVIAELGLVTPPMGLNAFVVSKYSNIPVTQVFWGIVPHVLAHFVVIALLLIFPAIVLWLPSQM